jgi:hypothetical protein
MGTKGNGIPAIHRTNRSWSAPAERSGDGAFPRLNRARFVSQSCYRKSLNCNASRAGSCQIVGVGGRHDFTFMPAIRF